MNMVADMLLADPKPAIIWSMLLLLTFPAMLLLGSPEAMRHPRQAARELVAVLRERGERRRQELAEALDTARYAEEVRVAADRATAGAERWRQRWQQTEDELSTAWQAWLDADTRLKSLLTMTAWSAPWSMPTRAEDAARERFLLRTVTAAAERGELPASAVQDVLAGRAGWDPRLHPMQQELAVARASAAWLRERYEEAVTAERRAWHDAELARRAGDSLRREAHTATARAAQFGDVLAAQHRTAPRAGRYPVGAPALREAALAVAR